MAENGKITVTPNVPWAVGMVILYEDVPYEIVGILQPVHDELELELKPISAENFEAIPTEVEAGPGWDSVHPVMAEDN